MTLNEYFARRDTPTKAEFARRVGMSKSYLGRLCVGSRKAGPRWMAAIVKATGGRVLPRDLNRMTAPMYTKKGTLRGKA